MSDTELWAILLNNFSPLPAMQEFHWVSEHVLIHKSRVHISGKSLCPVWPYGITLRKTSISQEAYIITYLTTVGFIRSQILKMNK